LRGQPLESPAMGIMNKNPIAARRGTPRDAILATVRESRLHQIPVVDEHGVLVGLETVDDLLRADAVDTPVVLMAGGPGFRLRPLTEHTPKPLLAVGAKPLIETILDSLVGQGFRRFFIAVNYKKEMIKEALGDGTGRGCTIRYLEENERLGTAGALALLPELPATPMLVMNGDLLTTLNFRHLLRYHAEQNCLATVCVREHVSEIPFGVIETEGNRVRTIEEKPSRRCFINAGIYVLDPGALALLPKSGPCDMTTLVARALSEGRTVAAFPIREFWLDIGRPDDYAAANSLFAEMFG
jgi:NDP-sugar pyrophosphorylase family protein